MTTKDNPVDFTPPASRAVRIRKLYRQLEERNHGGAWTTQEDMIGFMSDVGELGRLLMASEGRWVHAGDLPKELGDKLAECMWWIFVLSDRLGIDISQAFSKKMDELDSSLSASVEKPQTGQGNANP